MSRPKRSNDPRAVVNAHLNQIIHEAKVRKDSEAREKDVRKRLGELLKELRREAKLNTEDASAYFKAEKLDEVTASTIRSVEAGRTSARLSIIYIYAAFIIKRIEENS